ncbi:TPA: hypothetical protein N2940_003255 [Vibrio parahaemolyticus]|uniref:hypothetical protein n=1 Tax=Vibrio parahaemolyticus TaxID=670 RepID=UPI00094255AE|nr:hypothetical protein [Vibrio parahaemolyticus]MDG2679177.1 hypothetical protein [Vibrio parahaemolyticus]OKY29650.1 hypothetical protein BTU71_14790 [Vibrio parahaemolyticus]HCM1390329.1 hypothetical protein [Vibrio parahaemolyticus]
MSKPSEAICNDLKMRIDEIYSKDYDILSTSIDYNLTGNTWYADVFISFKEGTPGTANFKHRSDVNVWALVGDFRDHQC